MYILHLSDLHFGTNQNAECWHGQLVEDLDHLLKETGSAQPHHLDAVILSGDIANTSLPEEYDAAELFINKLIESFGLKRSQLLIVPGNHDVNWTISKSSYNTSIKREDYQGSLEGTTIFEENIIINGDHILVPDAAQYSQRFQYFSQFYERVVGKPYSSEPGHQYELSYFADQDLLMLGLNSAWKLNHHAQYQACAGINPLVINHALAEIRKNLDYQNARLKIAVWHHPLYSPFEDRIKEQGFMQQLAKRGFRLALHGHIHKANAGLYGYLYYSPIDVIAAGTFGAPMREWVPGFPLQYNLLQWTGNTVKIHTRKRAELEGAWEPDSTYVIELDRSKPSSSCALVSDSLCITELSHNNPTIRIKAAQNLAFVSHPDGIDALIRRLKQEYDPQVWYWLAYALGQTGDPRARQALEGVQKKIAAKTDVISLLKQRAIRDALEEFIEYDP